MTYPTYRYNCVGARNLYELNYIIDHARQISYRTIVKAIGPSNIREFSEMMGYNKYLTLNKDWAVSFYKSKLPNKKPVWFILHSAIEYIYY